MGFVIVFAISAGVGVLVFRFSGREILNPTDAGFEVAPVSGRADEVEQWAGAETAPADGSYGPAMVQVSSGTSLPVVAARRSWHSRLNGALGLVLAIGVGAAAMAFALYGAGMMLARLVSGSAGGS